MNWSQAQREHDARMAALRSARVQARRASQRMEALLGLHPSPTMVQVRPSGTYSFVVGRAKAGAR